MTLNSHWLGAPGGAGGDRPDAGTRGMFDLQIVKSSHRRLTGGVRTCCRLARGLKAAPFRLTH